MNPIAKTLVWLAFIMTVIACGRSDKEQCAANDQFAYIGHDGNIFLYDFCQEASVQLTNDARLNSTNGMSTYFFYDSENAWSSSQPHLIAGISNISTVIDAESKSKDILGQATNATWSPSGNLIAVSNDDANHGITIVDEAGSTSDQWIYGTAPMWLNETHLIYLHYPDQEQTGALIQSIGIYDLSESEQADVALPGIQLSSFVHSYARSGYLSYDGSLAAFYNSGHEGFSGVTMTSITSSNQDSNWWHVYDGHQETNPPYRWSPTKNTLAVCEGVFWGR